MLNFDTRRGVGVGGREWQGSGGVSIVCEGPAKSAKFKTHEVGGGGVSATGILQWDRVAAKGRESRSGGTSTVKIKLWYKESNRPFPLYGT